MTFEPPDTPAEPDPVELVDTEFVRRGHTAVLGVGVHRPSGILGWWAAPLAAIGVLVAVAPLVLSFVPSSAAVHKSRCTAYDTSVNPPVCTARVDEAIEYALVPADAEQVEPRLSINGATTYDTKGRIYFVTITEPKISLLDWLVTRDDAAARFLSHHDKYGDQTAQQLTQSGQQQMRSAKDNAVYVALKAAGYPVELKPGDVVVDFLLCLKANEAGTECEQFSPADKLLNPGDHLTAVDGTPLKTVDDLPPILKGISPGTSVEIEFTRNGTPMKGTIETIAAPNEQTQRTIIGFRPIDTTTVELPDGINVQINTDLIGGPSAGLAFTLTLIDQLTEGDLMGGKKVAVTGTIDLNGNVGAIGGLNSKASAVQQVGVKYFLVPAAQDQQGWPDTVAAARKVVGNDVQIIPVATLQEALDALVRIGGDPVKLATLPAT